MCSNKINMSSKYRCILLCLVLNLSVVFNLECRNCTTLNRCCPINHMFEYRNVTINNNTESVLQCILYNGTLDFSNVTIYDANKEVTDKIVSETFQLTYNDSFNTDKLLNLLFIFNHYLTDTGVLYVEEPNAYDRWEKIEKENYCMGHENGEDGIVAGWWILIADEEETAGQNLEITATAMYSSSVFFILVLIVYGLLPELRNLYGMVLMAYVASEMVAFLSLATLQLLCHYGLNNLTRCLILSSFIYYFFLATFCWMNIMSFDIWWTFRGYAKARPIHRRGEKFKFLVYCGYAWGLPLLMTLSAVILNSVKLRHIPWLVTPQIPSHGCFLTGGEKFIYLYVPMLILLTINWILFLMTTFNIWRLHRITAVLNTSENRVHHSHRQRFGVYLKLSVVMGVSWVLEVTSLYNPQLVIWKFTDAYNLLVGFFIFLIFICKRKIIRMLIKRWRGETIGKAKKWNGSHRSAKSNSSGSAFSDSKLTNDTISQTQISYNPKGNNNYDF